MDPFIGEIRIFAGNFAPNGWEFCNGQLLAISTNTALFSLLGTTYGGDGQTTFALPDFRGRFPMQPGQGPGLSDRAQGEQSGASQVALTSDEIPAHTHAPACVSGAGETQTPAGALLAAEGTGVSHLFAGAAPDSAMAPAAIASAGAGQPHNNMPPYLALSFIIAVQGIFPPRN